MVNNSIIQLATYLEEEKSDPYLNTYTIKITDLLNIKMWKINLKLMEENIGQRKPS